MPPVIRWQVEPIGLAVGRRDDEADVRYVILSDVLRIDIERVRWRGEHPLRPFVEGDAIHVAEVASLGDVHHDGLEVLVDLPRIFPGDTGHNQ